ncbi:MAG: hypothetical protein ACYTKD_16200, partial [Planctomycetota bacterium]
MGETAQGTRRPRSGVRAEPGEGSGGTAADPRVAGEEHVRVSHAAGTVIEMDADGNVSLVEAGGNIKLGSGALKKLVNETLLDLFNQHTHPYQNGTPVYGWAAPPATETQ